MTDTPVSSAAAERGERKSIQVIERMTVLLDILARHPGALPLKTLSAESGLHPSTAHRILAAMAQGGLIERRDSGSYRLGIRLLELGSLVKSRISLRGKASPHMRRLHEQTGESVNLGIRDGDEIVYVERSSSGRAAVRVVHIVGTRAPLHTAASGKLFLAAQSDAEVDEYVQRTGLPAQTPASITRPAQLVCELQTVRERGFARDLDEVETGVRCLAAGIYDDLGQLVAGLSLSMPSDRFSMEHLQALRGAARAISYDLGFCDALDGKRGAEGLR